MTGIDHFETDGDKVRLCMSGADGGHVAFDIYTADHPALADAIDKVMTAAQVAGTSYLMAMLADNAALEVPDTVPERTIPCRICGVDVSVSVDLSPAMRVYCSAHQPWMEPQP